MTVIVQFKEVNECGPLQYCPHSKFEFAQSLISYTCEIGKHYLVSGINL